MFVQAVRLIALALWSQIGKCIYHNLWSCFWIPVTVAFDRLTNETLHDADIAVILVFNSTFWQIDTVMDVFTMKTNALFNGHQEWSMEEEIEKKCSIVKSNAS